MNNPVIANNEGTYIFIDLNGSKYMMNTRNILEIVKLPYLENTQNLPKYVSGLLDYNSVIINVLDLKSLLGLEKTIYTLNSRLIIVEHENMRFALVADKVSDIQRIDKNFVQNTPYENKNGIIQKIYTPKDESGILILSVKAIADILKNSIENMNGGNTTEDLMPKNEHSLEIMRQRSIELKNKNYVVPYSVLDEMNQFIVFKIGDGLYCLKNTFINGFHKLNKSKITPVPCTPNFIAGLINLRGDCICVVDLRAYLERGETKINEKSTIIIIEAGEAKIGILADEIGQIINIDETAYADKNSETFDFVRNSQIYCVINMVKILNNDKLYIK